MTNKKPQAPAPPVAAPKANPVAPVAAPKTDETSMQGKPSVAKMNREQAQLIVNQHEGINGVEQSAELKQARAVLRGE